MRSSLAAGMVYLATIVLAFGVSISVISLLSARYGSGNEFAQMWGVGLLVAGGLIAGASFLLRRASKS